VFRSSVTLGRWRKCSYQMILMTWKTFDLNSYFLMIFHPANSSQISSKLPNRFYYRTYPPRTFFGISLLFYSPYSELLKFNWYLSAPSNSSHTFLYSTLAATPSTYLAVVLPNWVVEKLGLAISVFLFVFYCSSLEFKSNYFLYKTTI